MFEQGEPTEDHNYIRQRKGQPVLTHRGRVVYWYDGVRHQTAAYRLVYIRYHGSIDDGLDVAHLCENNGNCGNPNHLIALPRGWHRKFDAEQRAWVKAIKELCPNAKGIYGTIPKGFVTNKKQKRRNKNK